MKIGCFEIINVEKRIKEIYGSKKDTEAAYLAYRVIRGVDIKESHRVVKNWLKK